MDEALYNAKSELKRADHLIRVSLKYTRTVDVIKHVIQRLISAVDFAMQSLLLYHKQKKGDIDEVPKLAPLRIAKIRELYPDDHLILNHLDFYKHLKKIDKADFDRAREFRRHVTMTAHLDTGESVEVTIDIITDYDERVREFVDHVERIVLEKGEEDDYI